MISTHCHSRNKGIYKVVVCWTMSVHAKGRGGIIMRCVYCGSLRQKVEHAYLKAIIGQFPLKRHIQYIFIIP